MVSMCVGNLQWVITTPCLLMAGMVSLHCLIFIMHLKLVTYGDKQNITGFTELTGRPAGFLIGQQRGPTDKKIGNPIVDLKDRSGNPLIFTPDVSLFFSTETKGIRTNKYPLDPATMKDGSFGSTNEFVFFRLSDALLMKAEAILRGGTSATTAHYRL